MRITFSKHEFATNGLCIISPEDSNFTKYYRDFLSSSHESYPSIWAPAIYFSERLKKLSNSNDLSCKLIDTYLKGIFFGILKLKIIDFNQIKDDIFKILNNQWEYKNSNCPNLNSIGDNTQPNGWVVLEFNNQIVAANYPDCLFYPQPIFSSWPNQPERTSTEFRMISEIENYFNNLHNDAKNSFYSWVKKLYDNYSLGNPSLASVLAKILEGKSIPQHINIDQASEPIQDFKVMVFSKENYIDFINLRRVKFPKIEFLNIEVDNSIKINLKIGGQDRSIVIEKATIGLDGGIYILDDNTFSAKDCPIQIKTDYGVIVLIDDIGAEKVIKFEFGDSIKAKPAVLILRSPTGDEIHRCNINLINVNELFVKKIIAYKRKYPDNALKKVFQRIPSKGTAGLECLLNASKVYEIKSGGQIIASKKYDNTDIIQDDNLIFSIWPDKLLEGWKPYFIFFKSNDKFIKVGNFNDFVKIEPSYVKKVSAEKIKNEFCITIFEKDSNNTIELGSFDLKMEKLERTQRDISASIAIDLGSTNTVAFSAPNISGEKPFQIQIGMKVKNLFSEKLEDLENDIVKLPSKKLFNQIPSKLYKITDFGEDEWEKGFEVANLIYNDEELVDKYKEEMIIKDIKWTADAIYVKAYLYILNLMVLWNFINKKDVNNITYAFSFPIVFQKPKLESFKKCVEDVINKFKEEISIIKIEKEPKFFPETDALISRAIGYEKDVLIIDLGGGTTDIVYYSKKENKVLFVDSLKVAGEKFLDLYFELFNKQRTFKETNKLLNSQIQKAQNNDFINCCSALLHAIFNYCKLGCQIRTKSSGFQQELSKKLPDFPDINIIFAGNGWRLFENVEQFKDFNEEIQALLKNGKKININYDPKNIISEEIAKKALRSDSMMESKGIISFSGINAVWILTIDGNTQKLSIAFEEEIPKSIENRACKLSADDVVIKDKEEYLKNLFGNKLLNLQNNDICKKLIENQIALFGVIQSSTNFVRSPLSAIIENQF